MKKLSRYFWISCVSLGLLLSTMVFGSAEVKADSGADAVSGVKKTIRLGRVILEPQVGVTAEHSDNINLRATDENDDYIFSLSPGIHARYLGAPGNYLAAGYDLTLAFYQEYDEQNYQTHAPYIGLGFKSPSGFFLNAREAYVNTADTYGAENRYGEGRKVRRWNNQLGLTLGYEFAKRFGIEGSYGNLIASYSSDIDQWQNRMDHQLGTAVFYRVAAKVLVLGQYRMTFADYPKQNDGIDSNGDGIVNPYYEWNSGNSQDYTLYDYFVGVRFEPGQRALGEFKIGYGQKKFENDVSRGGLRYMDQDSWVAETDFSYRFFRHTKLSVLFKRAHRGSPDAYSSSYTDTTFGGRINQGLGPRLSVSLGGEYSLMDYADEEVSGYPAASESNPERYFHIYALSTGFDWKILQWLSAGVSLSYVKKTASDSVYETEEYENRKISFRANAAF